MGEIEITELNAKDWQVFKALRLELLQTDPPAYARTYEESVHLSDDAWRDILSKRYYIGAKIKKTLVGIIGVQIERDNGYATLLSVGVSQKYRKMGIARQIMQVVISQLKVKHIHKIKLWVSETQHPAIAFYESFGFKYSTRKKDKVAVNGKLYDELLMEKELM